MLFFGSFLAIVAVLSGHLHYISCDGSIRREVVDGKGNYIVEWKIDHDNNKAVFETTVKSKGFVGFGLSRNGAMFGADIVIGGILPNGTTYFQDYHGVGNTFPVVDQQQDWFLESVSENETHTMMRFWRLLDTCDPHGHDLPIQLDTIKIIWSYGQSDHVDYHFGNRGAYTVDLLDPPSPNPSEVRTSEYEVWNLTSHKLMPQQSTTYWCSMHRVPDFVNKTHVVGFNVRTDTQETRDHLHHIVVWNCDAPNDVDPETHFEPFVSKEGAECYELSTIKEKKLPVFDCREILYVWATGGKPQNLPDHVGYPVGEKKQYVLLEVHYNNPNEVANLSFPAQVEIFHTSKLRKYDAGVLLVDHSLSTSHLAPPKSKDFTLVGHCSSDCTKKQVRKEGINLFNVLLHSHLAGRKLKLRHFRENQELPWIAYDNNYDFDFQQNRPLREEVKVLPGDQISYECTYDTMDRENVTLGGLSTKDEMCQSFIWYYPKSPLMICGSRYESDSFYKFFGIENVTYTTGKPVVTGPESVANKTFAEAVDTTFNWTPELQNEMQKMLQFEEHTSRCYSNSKKSKSTNATSTIPKIKTTYPKIDDEYIPISQCSKIKTD